MSENFVLQSGNMDDLGGVELGVGVEIVVRGVSGAVLYRRQ